MKNDSPKGWYFRGYLPHFDNERSTQFITYRLADSLPQRVLNRIRILKEHERISEREYRIWIDRYLDKGIGACHLQDPKIANIVEENLLYFEGVKYTLHSWVIMPNHVHFLYSPLDGKRMSDIVHSMKSFTSNSIQELLGTRGRLWFPEVFDRYIRDYEHFRKTVRYIEQNPVKAKLCNRAEEWRFSSAWWNERKNG